MQSQMKRYMSSFEKYIKPAPVAMKPHTSTITQIPSKAININTLIASPTPENVILMLKLAEIDENAQILSKHPEICKQLAIAASPSQQTLFASNPLRFYFTEKIENSDDFLSFSLRKKPISAIPDVEHDEKFFAAVGLNLGANDVFDEFLGSENLRQICISIVEVLSCGRERIGTGERKWLREVYEELKGELLSGGV